MRELPGLVIGTVAGLALVVLGSLIGMYDYAPTGGPVWDGWGLWLEWFGHVAVGPALVMAGVGVLLRSLIRMASPPSPPSASSPPCAERR
ncbi:hypothetical protein [Streptomyces sp. NPDC097619]|uniref:hypothetical protein n=1 Tax=Streptomyces sp. NPDC097619 TaxID=3157228 RepID=UPI0033179549